MDNEAILVRHILSRSIEVSATGDWISVEKDADELTVIRLRLALGERLVETLAGCQVEPGRVDLVATCHQQLIAVDCQTSLGGDTLAELGIQMSTGIILPFDIPRFSVNSLNIGAVAVDDACGEIGDTVFH